MSHFTGRKEQCDIHISNYPAIYTIYPVQGIHREPRAYFRELKTGWGANPSEGTQSHSHSHIQYMSHLC